MYCGDKKELPVGYDIFGSSYNCLRKGFGAGMYSERKKWENKNLVERKLYTEYSIPQLRFPRKSKKVSGKSKKVSGKSKKVSGKSKKTSRKSKKNF